MAKSVNFVYLVPNDKTENATYVAAYEEMVRKVQDVYRAQSGNGKTFPLNDPIIEVVVSTARDSDYFNTSNASSALSRLEGEYTSISGNGEDSDKKYVLWADADDSSMSAFRGVADTGNSFCMFKSSLIQDDYVNGGVYERERALRTVAHELGHLFGFGHGSNDTTIMAAVHGQSPTAFRKNVFRSSHQTSLSTNDFLTEQTDQETNGIINCTGLSSITH